MKILEINTVCGIRSTGRICTDIADILKEQGHECRIAYGRENVPNKYAAISYQMGTTWDARRHALSARIWDCAGFGSKNATNRLIAKINAYRPDVIHLHNIHGYYLNVEILFSYLAQANIPVIWTLHDCWAFTGHCAYFSLANCDRWKSGCYHCPCKHTYPTSYFKDASRQNYNRKKRIFTGIHNLTIVTPSQWLADLVKESFLKDYPVKVIHNGIDLSVFKPTDGNFRERYHLQDKKIILGVASQFGQRKGFDDFLRLADLIDDQFRIVLVGVSQKQIASLPKNIIGFERTNDVRELAEIYTSADVLFNPTYEDNYPTVNLEAQACQTPVITYRTGGSVESVPFDNVILQGDVASFVNRLKETERFSIKSAPEKRSQYLHYVNLYKEVMKEKANVE